MWATAWLTGTRGMELARIMAKQHKSKVHVAANELNADNGAMIALVAEKTIKSGMRFAINECGIDQKYRIDTVKVNWR